MVLITFVCMQPHFSPRLYPPFFISKLPIIANAFSLNKHNPQVEEKYPDYQSEDWRFELRVRYVLSDLHQLYDKDRTTFCYYYEQVRIILSYCAHM